MTDQAFPPRHLGPYFLAGSVRRANIWRITNQDEYPLAVSRNREHVVKKSVSQFLWRSSHWRTLFSYPRVFKQCFSASTLSKHSHHWKTSFGRIRSTSRERPLLTILAAILTKSTSTLCNDRTKKALETKRAEINALILQFDMEQEMCPKVDRG